MSEIRIEKDDVIATVIISNPRKLNAINVAMVAATIERGQGQGEISKRLDPEATARFVLNNIAGLRLLGTTSPTGAEVAQVVEMVLKVLD